MACTATGDERQTSSAKRVADSSAAPGAVTSLTTPSACARSAVSSAPVIISCLATWTGSARSARNRAPDDGISPRRDSGNANRAVVDATIRSHASAISKPPPNATPFHGGDQRLAPAPPDEAVLAAALGLGVAAGPQIGARTEDVGGARQHADPQVVIVVEGVQSGTDADREFPVDGVALLRPLHGDHQDPVPTLHVDAHR